MDEIEEFLRRAAQRRREQPAQQQPAEEPARAFQQQPLYEPEIMEAEILEPDPPQRHPLESQHLPKSSLAERTSHFAEVIEHTDERTESHLHDAFDHHVGALDDSADALTGGIEHMKEFSYDQEGERYENKFVNKLVELFKNPENIAQAIVMKEIIERPKW